LLGDDPLLVLLLLLISLQGLLGGRHGRRGCGDLLLRRSQLPLRRRDLLIDGANLVVLGLLLLPTGNLVRQVGMGLSRRNGRLNGLLRCGQVRRRRLNGSLPLGQRRLGLLPGRPVRLERLGPVQFGNFRLQLGHGRLLGRQVPLLFLDRCQLLVVLDQLVFPRVPPRESLFCLLGGLIGRVGALFSGLGIGLLLGHQGQERLGLLGSQ